MSHSANSPVISSRGAERTAEGIKVMCAGYSYSSIYTQYSDEDTLFKSIFLKPGNLQTH